MKCILMNKNTEVLIGEYNDTLKVFSKIYEIKNIVYAPLIIYNAYKNDKNLIIEINNWFNGRKIPSFRDDLDLLLARLDVDRTEDLLDKAYGLSLSDQYFIKPTGSNVEYKDINFFDHNFSDSDFTNVTFSNTDVVVLRLV